MFLSKVTAVGQFLFLMIVNKIFFYHFQRCSLLPNFFLQIEEEEMLRAELRKIEAKKKEREKKTADLQKLIAQVDSSAAEVSSSEIPYSLLAHHLVHQLF